MLERFMENVAARATSNHNPMSFPQPAFFFSCVRDAD